MRILLAGLLAFTVGVLPVRGYAQEEDDDDEGNDSYEQSTEDSSDETTAESTNQPSRNTTDPSVELFWPLLHGGREPTESEGDYTDSDRAAALGISTLSIALVIVAIIAIASGGSDEPAVVTPSPEPPGSPYEQRASSWLTENDEQLRVDIARGAGPTLDDLAAAFALRPERRPAFGLAMRGRRTVLLAALDAPSGKTERVRGFLREVGVTMREDESTRADWENWRITYGVPVPRP